MSQASLDVNLERLQESIDKIKEIDFRNAPKAEVTEESNGAMYTQTVLLARAVGSRNAEVAFIGTPGSMEEALGETCALLAEYLEKVKNDFLQADGQ